MEKEFVTYELALRMKQLGFDEPCFAVWIEKDSRDGGGLKLEIWNDEDTEYEVKSSTKAPLFQQAFRWFREKYNLNRSIITNGLGEWDYTLDGFNYAGRIWDIYEEAELACLERLIEIVEQNSKQ
jgi:hypothetical protein